jgi:hypothetical protein
MNSLVGILPYINSGLEDCKLFFYKLYDDGPEFMLPLLKRHVEEYLKRNDNEYDTQHMSAWVFFEFMIEIFENCKETYANATQERRIAIYENCRCYRAFSFESQLIEYTDYVYIIYPDRIEAREGGWQKGKSEHKVIETIAIGPGHFKAKPEGRIHGITYEIPDMFVTN